jgi:plastocyanin
MSQDELVQRYLDGQMGRRVFIRRLIGTGVAATTALTYASILEAMPAGATVADFYVFVQDYSFTPKSAGLMFGQDVEFDFYSGNTHSHSATDRSGMHFFDTNFVAPSGEASVGFPVAGTYRYHCKEPISAHPPMTGQIRVPMKANPMSGHLGKKFTLTWATSVPAGYVVDLQRRAPGASDFSSWKHGVHAKEGTFTPDRKGTFTFQARLRKLSNGTHSDWSPSLSITVT